MEAPASTMIASAWPTLIGGEADRAYQTTPQPGLSGQPTLMPHGRVVGGSSQINGLLWTRGDPSDFDAWAHGGAPGWSYADLVPYFRIDEHVNPGQFRGRRQYLRQRGFAVGSGDQEGIPRRRSELTQPPGEGPLKSRAQRHG